VRARALERALRALDLGMLAQIRSRSDLAVDARALAREELGTARAEPPRRLA
jgi:hypothetical protein